MGVEEIIQKIKDNNLESFFFWCDLDWWEDEFENRGFEKEEDFNMFLNELGLSNYEEKDRRADTSEFWSVVYFPDYNIYLKFTGWFDSYEMYNHSYNGITQVFPKEITKTIYKPNK